MTDEMLLPTPRLLDGATVRSMRWCVLAPGAIANAFAQSLHRHSTQRIVAVGSRSLERAEHYASRHGIDRAYGSYEAALADPRVDIVYVASPHTAHAPLALAAIAAGKHVLVEKPLAASAHEARSIAEAALAAKVFAMEAMHTRFHPWVDVMDQLIADGVLGDPRFVAADVGRHFPIDPSSRLHDPLLGGGALLDLGVYAVWLAVHVAGPPNHVAAAGQLASTGVESQATVVMTTPSVHSVVSTTMAGYTPSRAVVAGGSGRVETTGRFPMPGSLAVYDGSNRLVGTFEDRTGLQGHDGLARQADWAAHHIDSGRLEAPQLPLSRSVAALEVIDRARAILAAGGSPHVEPQR